MRMGFFRDPESQARSENPEIPGIEILKPRQNPEIPGIGILKPRKNPEKIPSTKSRKSRNPGNRDLNLKIPKRWDSL